jgi:hypothetical protein
VPTRRRGVVPLVPKRRRERRECRRAHSSRPHGSVAVGTRGVVSRPATATLSPVGDGSGTEEEMVVLAGAAPGGGGSTNAQGSRVGEDGPCVGKASPGGGADRWTSSPGFGGSGEEHLAPSMDELRRKLLAARRQRGESGEVRLQVSRSQETRARPSFFF